MNEICLVFATCLLGLMEPPGRQKCESVSNARSFAVDATRLVMKSLILFASFAVALLSGRKLISSEKDSDQP